MKKRRRQRTELRSWCSARFSTIYEKPFVVIGKSLLQSPPFLAMKASSRMMYLTIALLCRGQDHFTFARSLEKRYCGIAPKTATDCKQELEASGFVTAWKQTYKKTEFAFIYVWKEETAPSAGKLYTKPWLSAHADGKEEDVLIIGVSLVECDQFINLSYQTRLIYLAMAMEAGASPRFLFPPAKAKEYGFSKSTLARAERELEASNFIEKDPNALTTPGAYQFCFGWKRAATIRGKPVNSMRI